MGVRLYIDSEDNAVIEQCAGVPAGTIDRLNEHKANFVPSGDDDPGYELYCSIHDDADLHAVDQYQLFGWGKFSGGDDSCAGNATGSEATALYLASAGMKPSLPIIELILEHGVYWC